MATDGVRRHQAQIVRTTHRRQPILQCRQLLRRSGALESVGQQSDALRVALRESAWKWSGETLLSASSAAQFRRAAGMRSGGEVRLRAANKRTTKPSETSSPMVDKNLSSAERGMMFVERNGVTTDATGGMAL